MTKGLSNRLSWTFDDIIKRTEEFANKAVEIWKFSKPIPTLDLESTSIKSNEKIYSFNEDTEIYCKGPSASATANVINNSLVRVHKGSTARKEIATSFEEHGYMKLRNQLITEGVLVESGDSLMFTSDYDFQSPSAAAAVVLGRSSNGQSDWKDINDASIGKLSAETNEEITARVDSDFVKRMVKGIPQWINNEYLEGEVIINGTYGSDRYLKIRGKTVLYYYYAKKWIFAELRDATSEEIKIMREGLSEPESIQSKENKAIRFHLINDNDLKLMKEIIRNRAK